MVDSSSKGSENEIRGTALAKEKAKKKKQTGKTPGLSRGKKKAEKIIIDENLSFKNETELYKYFQEDIIAIEEFYYKTYDESSDIQEENFGEYEDLLVDTLSNPDFIHQSDIISNEKAQHFVKTYESTTDEDSVYYVVVAYVSDEDPAFVYIHFPTTSEELYKRFRTGEVLLDAQEEYENGDALADGDELAIGLHSAMLKIRSEKDIPEANFGDYRHHRDEGIEEPDEIWRDPDLQGNTLVTFIKDFSEGDKDLFYVSVAVEDKVSDSHLLLFSFPTTDKTLVERYRHGENLHAEEIETSDSH